MMIVVFRSFDWGAFRMSHANCPKGAPSASRIDPLTTGIGCFSRNMVSNGTIGTCGIEPGMRNPVGVDAITTWPNPGLLRQRRNNPGLHDRIPLGFSDGMCGIDCKNAVPQKLL